MEAAAELGDLAQPSDLSCHVNVRDVAAVEGVDQTFGQTDRAQRNHFMVVVHRYIEPAARVHSPVPVRLARQGSADAAPHLVLDLHDQVLEQVWNFGRLRLAPEGVSFLVEAVLSRHLRQQLEQDTRDVWAAFRRERGRVRHFDDQRRAPIVVKNDLGDFQGIFRAFRSPKLLTFAPEGAIIILALVP